MRKFFWIFLIAATFFFSGCGASDKKEAAPSDAPASAPVSSGLKAPDLSTAGTLSGRVLFEGAAPAPKQISIKGTPECAALHPGGVILSEELLVKDGGIANAFVYIKQGLEGYLFPTPSESVTVANNGCMYVPHVVGVQVNQSVVFLNNDSTLHNIHAFPKANKPFNLGLPLTSMKQTKKFAEAEVMVPMKCDVHSWMQGYIGVVPHPYFAVTDASGNFKIANLPAGDYVVEVWQEKLGVQSQKVRIEPQKTQNLEFKYTA